MLAGHLLRELQQVLVHPQGNQLPPSAGARFAIGPEWVVGRLNGRPAAGLEPLLERPEIRSPLLSHRRSEPRESGHRSPPRRDEMKYGVYIHTAPDLLQELLFGQARLSAGSSSLTGCANFSTTGRDIAGRHAELAHDVRARGHRVELGEDRVGDEQDELVGAPRLVDACREALGAGEGAPQEDLRVKNGLERGQRVPPPR